MNNRGNSSYILNSPLPQDAYANVVINLDPELAIARGLFRGYDVVNKFGRIPSISSGTGLSVDCWGGRYCLYWLSRLRRAGSGLVV